MSYDGTIFVLTDSDAVGDATTDSQPVDQFVDRRIRSNNIHLANGIEATGVGWYTANAPSFSDSTGCRPLTGLGDFTVLALIPIWIEPHMTGITINLFYNAMTRGSVLKDVDFRVALSGSSQRFYSETSTASTGWRVATLQYDLNERPTVSGYQQLVISARGGRSGSAVPVTGLVLETYDLTANTIISGSVSNPDDAQTEGSPDTVFLQPLTNDQIDVLGYDGGTTLFLFHRAQPTRNAVNPATGNPAFAAIQVNQSFLQLRSVQVRAQYDGERFVNQSVSSLDSRIPLLGSATSAHIGSINGVNARPRLLSYGPSGYVSDLGGSKDASWPTGYPSIWPVQDARDQGLAYLIDECVFIDEANSLLTFNLYFACTTIFREASGEYFETLWNMTVEALSLEDGDDWADATTFSNADIVSVRTYGVDRNSDDAFGRTCYLLENYGRGTNDDPNTFDPYNYVYSEGKLTSEDYYYITPVQMTVRLTDYQSSNPIRLRLSATFDGYPVDFATKFELSTRLFLVGYSIYRG
jgi:hypothetical protein